MIRYCSLIRRLAAVVYDTLLLVALFFLFTVMLLPFTGGEAIASGNLLFTLYLLVISYLYFTWQWIHGGQTLGMKSWRVKLIGENQIGISWLSASKRFVLAIISWIIFGLGFIWALSNRNRITFHDRYSQTRLIVLI